MDLMVDMITLLGYTKESLKTIYVIQKYIILYQQNTVTEKENTKKGKYVISHLTYPKKKYISIAQVK